MNLLRQINLSQVTKRGEKKSPQNAQAWSEAIKGFESGLEISVIVKWLKKEHDCPLSYHTIRTQLNDSK